MSKKDVTVAGTEIISNAGLTNFQEDCLKYF
jgi:hypothetical protein